MLTKKFIIIYVILDYFILLGRLKVEKTLEISTCQPVFRFHCSFNLAAYS